MDEFTYGGKTFVAPGYVVAFIVTDLGLLSLYSSAPMGAEGEVRQTAFQVDIDLALVVPEWSAADGRFADGRFADGDDRRGELWAAGLVRSAEPTISAMHTAVKLFWQRLRRQNV